VLLAGVVTVVNVRPVTLPTPLLMLNVSPEPPLTDHASVVAIPVVLVEGVAVNVAIEGAGLIVTELCAGTCRSLTTRTLRTEGAVVIEKVMAREFSPEMIVPFVKDQK
jgi:hypothetical protein